jgi:hypothetical protein
MPIIGGVDHRPSAKASRPVGITEPKRSQNPKDRPFTFSNRIATVFLKMLSGVFSKDFGMRQSVSAAEVKSWLKCANFYQGSLTPDFGCDPISQPFVVQKDRAALGFAKVAPFEVFRKISQNFSPAGVTSPFVARAIPTDITSVVPVSGR